jgi:hypothetical protein
MASPVCCTIAGARARHSWRVRRNGNKSRSPPPALVTQHSPPPLSLVCFIASHVASSQRVRQLEDLLHSIYNQQPRSSALPPVAISWSAASIELADAARRVLDTAISVRRHWRLQHYEQSEQRSQFEHLRILTSHFADCPPEWVFFSDDDDLWSEHRHAVYLKEIMAASMETHALLCRRKAMPLARARALPLNASAVRDLLAAGEARLADSNRPDGLEEEEYNMAEYFDLALRFASVRDFFATMPDYVVGHKLCDLAFCFLMSNDLRTVKFLPSGSHATDFIYFYARGNQAGGASNSLSVGEHELEIARHMAPPTMRLAFEDVSGCARFVSGLRQGIEQELIRLRVTGSVVPLQMVDAACLRQAEVVIKSRCLDDAARGALDRQHGVRNWARELAVGPLRNHVLSRFEFEAVVDWDTWTILRVEPLGSQPPASGSRRRRGAEEILAEECAYMQRAPGGLGPPFVLRIGMWIAPAHVRPPSNLSTLGRSRGPHTLLRAPTSAPEDLRPEAQRRDRETNKEVQAS